MLHPRRVMLALYYATRRRVRVGLRIPARIRPPPVLSAPLAWIVERHGSIARFILEHFPPQLDLAGEAVCEIGAGDCLAGISLFLAKGARQVDIVQMEKPVSNAKQLEVLESLKRDGLPIDLTVIQRDDGLRLDGKRVTHHPCYMEDFKSKNAHALIFSYHVLEHVEDLPGFYASCWKTVRPGGWMLHLVDLSGHQYFEDPLPPLDFQTYSDWLYGLMFPRYQRATRRFFREHLSAISAAGFQIHAATPTRVADPAYVDRLRPKLRPAARARPLDELQVLEFAVLANKPDSM